MCAAHSMQLCTCTCEQATGPGRRGVRTGHGRDAALWLLQVGCRVLANRVGAVVWGPVAAGHLYGADSRMRAASSLLCRLREGGGTLTEKGS